jgi:hypothetical protein
MTALLVASNILLWAVTLTLLLITLACVQATVVLNRRIHQTSPSNSVPTILGQPLPDVSLRDENDKPARLLDADPHPGVVFVITPSCAGCSRLIEDSREAIEGAAASGVPVTVIAMAGTHKEFSRLRHRLNLSHRVRIFRDSDGGTTEAWQVEVTPLVLVVKQGRVFYMGKAPSTEWVRTELAHYSDPLEVIASAPLRPANRATAGRADESTTLTNKSYGGE